MVATGAMVDESKVVSVARRLKHNLSHSRSSSRSPKHTFIFTSFPHSAMADQDESAKLWKVNRTIHELVKDRVSTLHLPSFVLGLITSGLCTGLPSFG